MAENKPNPIVHILPSLTDVAFALPLVFMFTILGGAKALLGDGDTGWHIRTGEWILANHRVPHTDIFSFTKPGAPWFAWEWLSDVIFAVLHQQWGLGGVVLLGMLLLCFSSALLFRLVQRRCSNPLISITFTFFAIAASTIHWHVRPHLFTIFFTVAFLYILDRVQGGETRLLVLLPILTAIWTNLHGGFFIGLFFLVCYGLGELVSYALAPDKAIEKAALRAAYRYGLTFAISCVATLINPYAFKLPLFIFHFLGQPYLHSISEYLTPNFHNIQTRFFEAILMPALGLVFWSASRRRFADILIIVSWAHFSLYAARNVPIFVIAAAPVAAGALDEIIRTLQTAQVARWCRSMSQEIALLGSEIAEVERAWRLHVISFVVFAAVSLAVLSGRLSEKYSAHFDTEHFPVAAAEVLAARPATSRVYTPDQWADFLIYRMYPHWRVFYDGRADMYGNEFFQKYSKIMNAGQDWQKDLDSYRVDSVLLPIDAPLTGTLKASRGWRPVYDDHHAIIFDRLRDQSSDFRAHGMRKQPGCDPDVSALEDRHLPVAVNINSNRDQLVTPKAKL